MSYSRHGRTSWMAWLSPKAYIILCSCILLPIYFMLYSRIHEGGLTVGSDKLSRRHLVHLRNELYALVQTQPPPRPVHIDWNAPRPRGKRQRKDEILDEESIAWFKERGGVEVGRTRHKVRRVRVPVPPEADLVSYQIEARHHTPAPRGPHSLPVLYVNALGRYGNNLFQVASAYGIARATGRELVIAPHLWYALYPFVNNSVVVGVAPDNVSVVSEGQAGRYDPSLLTSLTGPLAGQDALVCCYLQSWRYLTPHIAPLRALFTLSDTWRRVGEVGVEWARQTYLLEISRRLKQDHHHTRLPRNLTLVGVHVRLQDVADPEARRRGYRPAPLSYLSAAMDWYRKQHTNVLFLVVTDQVQWCRHNFTRYHNDAVIASQPGGAAFYQDFAILLQCQHLIITVGTFGWFAGWLSQGTVVYYSDWPVPGTEIDRQYHIPDYYPPHWVPMAGR